MWWLTLAAFADPCTDALELDARHVSPSGIVASLADAPWTPADVACLAEYGAPHRVLRLAGRRADVPLPPDPRPRRWTIEGGASYVPAVRVSTATLVGVGLGWSPAPLLTLALDGDLGIQPSPGYTQLIGPPEPLVLQDGVIGTGRITVAIAPVSGTATVGRAILTISGFARFGGGVIATRDDVWLAEVSADLSQLHPTLVVGGGLNLLARATGLRIAGDMTRWVEIYDETEVTNRSFGAVSAEFLIRL